MHRMLWVTAFAVGVGLAITVWVTLTRYGGSPVDAACYYAIDPARPYDSLCFAYSPPVALVMGLVREIMAFETFAALLRAIETALLTVISGPFVGPLLFVPPVAIELNAANINIIVTAAALLSLRHAWVWPFVLLTKVTPVVLLLWYVVRREWAKAALALGLTAAIAGASYLVAPHLWAEYLDRLLVVEQDVAPWPVGLRLPVAAILVVVAARSDRRWLMIVALYLSMPRLYWLTPVVLVGLLPLFRWTWERIQLVQPWLRRGFCPRASGDRAAIGPAVGVAPGRTGPATSPAAPAGDSTR